MNKDMRIIICIRVVIMYILPNGEITPWLVIIIMVHRIMLW